VEVFAPSEISLAKIDLPAMEVLADNTKAKYTGLQKYNSPVISRGCLLIITMSPFE
jgi:hypothetical protein